MRKILIATGQNFAVLDPLNGDPGDGASPSGAWNVSVTLRDEAVQCLAVDPREPDVIYAGSHGNGLFGSRDGGRTWTSLDLPERDVFSVAVSPADGAVYAGCEPSKLFKSADGGASWTELSALREIPSAPTWSFPPRPWTSHVRWIAPDPHDARRLLAGIELGGVMLTEDGGATWRDHPPQAIKDCHAVMWHPSAPGRAYEAGGGGGAAWSKDGGKTWERTVDGLDRFYGWGLAVDPDDADCWYVSASPGPGHAHGAGSAEAYIYRWQGDGPWERLTAGPNGPLDAMPYALAVLSGEVYAGLSDGRLLYSADRGDSWSQPALRGDALASVRAMAVVA